MNAERRVGDFLLVSTGKNKALFVGRPAFPAKDGLINENARNSGRESAAMSLVAST
jgi:hypothetical protein